MKCPFCRTPTTSGIADCRSVEDDLVVEILKILWEQKLLTEQEKDRAVAIVKSQQPGEQ